MSDPAAPFGGARQTASEAGKGHGIAGGMVAKYLAVVM
jgi:hypothetical protein